MARPEPAQTRRSDDGDTRPSDPLLSAEQPTTRPADLSTRERWETRDRPERIGRFVVVDRLGAGGMGVVYSAYDSVLDRRVALKLVRGDRGDPAIQVRMLREAQALARLSHPNVVQVYEVGEYEGQVFLAMEFVRGENLRGWLAARWKDGVQPPAAAILERLLAAGEGLVAAHAAGIVHRDFKPDNVLVGEDGRVRVADFGLAALAGPPLTDSRARRPEGARGLLNDPLTVLGAVVGTPVYMAPEQLAGEASDVRADIFSFAVTLHEALLGVRPFRGDDLVDLRAAILCGERRELPAGVRAPPWIAAAIDRGLAAEPEARWPTMAAFLAALRDDPARRRRRIWGAVASAALLGAMGAAALVRGELRAERCEAAAAAASLRWDEAARARVEAALVASGSPHAADTWARTAARVDAWTDAWGSARLEACAADDGPLHAAREACLDRQLWRLDGLLDALARATPTTANRAVTAASSLPPPRRCDDLRWLGAVAAAGPRAAVDPAVELSQRHLARLRALLSAGAHEPVDAEVEPLRERLEAADQPAELVAEARLLRGAAKRMAGDYAEAEAELAAAYELAGRSGADHLAAEAAVTATALLGVDLDRRAEAAVWDRSAAVMLSRAGATGHELDARLRTTRGVLHRNAGEHAEALAAYREALAILEADLGPGHPTLARVHSNIANVLINMGDYAAAREHLGRGLQLFIDSYGPHHPDAAVFHSNLGTLLSQLGDEPGALAEHRLALASDLFNLGEAHPAVGVDRFNIGVSHVYSGDLERAAEEFARASAILEAKLGDSHPQLAFIWTYEGWVMSRRGDHEGGRARIERALALREAGPTDPADLAHTKLRLGQELVAAGDERERGLALVREAREVFAGDAAANQLFLDETDTWLLGQVRSADADAPPAPAP
ncbi:MAG: serine/threonine-protein kinase [Nannocystaceae bacterium]